MPGMLPLLALFLPGGRGPTSGKPSAPMCTYVSLLVKSVSVLKLVLTFLVASNPRACLIRAAPLHVDLVITEVVMCMCRQSQCFTRDARECFRSTAGRLLGPAAVLITRGLLSLRRRRPACLSRPAVHVLLLSTSYAAR